MESETTGIDVAGQSGRPSIVESFSIRGLYGYRSISMESPFAATVLIAKNGSGKTTLLGALDAFLKGQFLRLRELPFSEIRCKLRGVERELIITKEDIATIADLSADSEVIRQARKFEIEPISLLQFITERYDDLRGNREALLDDPVYDKIYQNIGFRTPDTLAFFDRLKEDIYPKESNVFNVSATVKEALRDIEVVYLPTYRRIELPLTPDAGERPYRGRKRPKFRFSSPVSLYAGDIQFGLSDILQRLAELNQTILSESNQGYRKISADIINELIDGTFERESFAATNIPDRDTLSVFFSRLKEGRNVHLYDNLSIPNIDKIYTDDGFGFETKKTLRYFLSKLDTVIQATRDIESRVEDFILRCNKYLSFTDTSVELPHAAGLLGGRPGQDDKVLRLNRRNLRVHAESVPSGRTIPLDSLSSGEKQMVSLFARLYLYPKEKIVLIDEPELSLSLDWQRNILPDVISAPLCKQVVAITHSPFVFDNALEPFARSLNLVVDVEALDFTTEEDEADARE